MTPRIPFAILFVLAIILLSACAKRTPHDNLITASSGNATVLSADAGLLEATLQTDNGARLAYWTKDTFFFRGETQLQNYIPPKGAKIVFKGIVTGRDLLLTHVWITKD